MPGKCVIYHRVTKLENCYLS